jgi:hypothetical protein
LKLARVGARCGYRYALGSVGSVEMAAEATHHQSAGHDSREAAGEIGQTRPVDVDVVPNDRWRGTYMCHGAAYRRML